MNFGNLATITDKCLGFVWSGMLRGIAGILLGSVCYVIARCIRKKVPTENQEIILGIVEVLAYLLNNYVHANFP